MLQLAWVLEPKQELYSKRQKEPVSPPMVMVGQTLAKPGGQQMQAVLILVLAPKAERALKQGLLLKQLLVVVLPAKSAPSSVLQPSMRASVRAQGLVRGSELTVPPIETRQQANAPQPSMAILVRVQ